MQNYADGVNFRVISLQLGEAPASVLRYHGTEKQPDTGNKTKMRVMSLKATLSTYSVRIQDQLLPWLDATMGSLLNGHHKQLVSVLGMVRIEAFLSS